MFVNDLPIISALEDKLERTIFSKNIAKAIFDWKGQESLVIALNGQWGSGKSSIINLAKLEMSNYPINQQPTIIEFNPWFFSGEEKINEHFYNEISKELKLKKSSTNDIEIANKLRMYSSLIAFIPSTSPLKLVIRNVFVIIAIIGISIPLFLTQNKYLHLCFYISSVLFLILSLFNKLIIKVADFFEKRSISNSKTILSFKEEINKHLKKREKKILIIIDDIDRLTSEEIKTLFRIIKSNSDFKNIIFLLSFDRDVVSAAIQTNSGISGREYLEKIVQVAFDVPKVSNGKISNIFISECNLVLEQLPKSSEKLFTDNYWNTIYNSGLKNLFKNVRDVKRFSNSLRFNLSFLHKGESMEVNPIDFIAIESLRIFVPEFYSFLKNRKALFTNVETDNSEITRIRKEELERSFDSIEEKHRDLVKALVLKLFPQINIGGNHKNSAISYSSVTAFNELRVSSPRFFDAYFTLIPGGSEAELSQYEVEVFLNKWTDPQILKSELKKFIENNKIGELLERIEHYTEDEIMVHDRDIPHIIEALFDIAESIPNENSAFLRIKSNYVRIIRNLLNKPSISKDDILRILEKSMLATNALFPVVYFVDTLISYPKTSANGSLFSEDILEDLKNIAVRKIIYFANRDMLLSNENLAFILFRWKNWTKTNDWDVFFNETMESNTGMVRMIRAFMSTMITHTSKEQIRTEYFDYKALDEFVSSDVIKGRLLNIIKSDKGLYENNKPIIDNFIDNFRIDPRLH